ncbi:hypothetical protein TCAL_02866 [Tigriopus californicus]|uniref:Protein-serine/threonine kinase n=1 Tax=Tigriopus californicus TaxID=6832 RepID=A0A553NZ07_TIGCA|nr:3-methyl-2-oxobutanoate dehydrogenase [lipoamide] kinase, mitochondrial-like [Tigriopus californicus]TRY70657.1 hypothetical protein TCAL_02866 [Tigriopus californicus]
MSPVSSHMVKLGKGCFNSPLLEQAWVLCGIRGIHHGEPNNHVHLTHRNGNKDGGTSEMHWNGQPNAIRQGNNINGKRWLNYNPSSKPTPSSIRERNITVASYYNQTAIDKAAAQHSVRLAPATIMYSGSQSTHHNVMRSAQYLHKELPIRIAHRISGIRSLPFIVGCNPTILSVHELYIRAFHILNDFPEIVTSEDEEKYSQVVKDLLDDHKDVVSLLAEGFRESRRHIEDEELVSRYLDRNLTSRLGIRMLATHHLHLKEKKDGHVGIVNVNMTLKNVIQRWITFVQQITEDRYGFAPAVKISGHISARFPYIEMPLDYILPELLKNAFRATIESHPGVKGAALPPVNVIIANNETDFIVKISDRGAGIPHDQVNKVVQYNFSTAEKSTDSLIKDDIFGNFMETMNRTTSGPMHGFGFGLPTSRAYAEYLGGSLQIYSMQGLGTDVYLRLKHFNARDTPFRI